MKESTAIFLLSVFTMALALLPITVFADCPAPGRGEAVLYEHSDFKGRCTVLQAGTFPDISSVGFPNDKASSVRLGTSAAIQLCQHKQFEGICEVLDRSDANFKDNRIRHDRASSAVVLGNGNAPFDCAIRAATPVFETASRVISGAGTRGPSCFSSTRIEVLLKQDRRFWFDRTLARGETRANEATVPVRYDCQGTGSQNVYVEIRAAGKKAQSRRLGVNFCS